MDKQQKISISRNTQSVPDSNIYCPEIEPLQIIFKSEEKKRKPLVFIDDKLLVRDKDDIYEFCSQNHINYDKFNHPVILADDIVDCSQLFWECVDFNQPVIIPEGVENCYMMFCHCKSFNQPVVIPSSVVRCDSMFFGCTSLNSLITIKCEVDDLSDFLGNCEVFNQPIIIPEGVKYLADMFNGCKSFNQPITIPSTAKDCNDMLARCHNFNQEIIIPSGVKHASQLLLDCTNFNSPLTICNFNYNENDYSDMLEFCRNYQSRLTILNDFELDYNLDIFDAEECPPRPEDIFEDIFYDIGLSARYHNPELYLSDNMTIKYFDNLMAYARRLESIEMVAWLLQFKNDHRDNFPNNNLSLD